MEFKIRYAVTADATGIGSVHIDSWRETYTGIVPETHLATLSKENSQKMWTTIIGQPKPDSFVKVAVADDQIVGFVSCGRARDKDLAYEGEVYAIYLRKQFQGLGIGKAMFQSTMEGLRERSMGTFYLWVLADNPTVAFYRAQGGRLGGDKVEEIGGAGFG
ncbi:MAG: GNAT family N-acetyltransferase [Pseudobacteriovorax sp.]|nr:GNAT family N-acetyltransferase [Pseudobacteriovorax sp.]